MRFQLWRWLTYQFTHAGLAHVLSNVVLNLLFGIPMEGVHGTRRMILMYNIGVFGGACFATVSTAHSSVVGMSAGCYALMGMHLADLVINWNQKRFRWPTLIFIAVMATLEITMYTAAVDGNNKSHSAHLGGYIAGTLIGIVHGRNYVVHNWERRLIYVSVLVGALIVLFCMCWSLGHWAPKDIWESTGWCWYRQVYSYQRLGHQWSCVRCDNQACVADWSKEPFIQEVSMSACSQLGWNVGAGL